MAVTDLERLVVTIEANTANIDKKLRALSGEADAAFGAVESRTRTFESRISDKFLSINRLTRRLSLGFAAVQAIGFGQNIVRNFDDITESARKYGIEVDRSLGEKMRVAEVAVSKAWTNMQLAAAPALASMAQGVANLINNLTGAPDDLDRLTNSLRAAQSVAQRNAGTGAGRAASAQVTDLEARIAAPNASANTGIRNEDFAGTEALRQKILNEKMADANRTAEFERSIAQKSAKDSLEIRKKLAEETRQIHKDNTEGTLALQEQIAKERNDAINNAANFDLQAEIDRQEEEAKALQEIHEKIFDAERDAENERLAHVERINERIVGEFAQAAADVIVESRNIGDAIRGLMQSFAREILQSTFTKAFAGTDFSKLLGFADGGRPPVGVPSIVGERGPEIFVPDVPGKIYPNGQGGGGGGSYFDLRGAVVTQDLLDQMNSISRRNSSMATAQAVKQSRAEFAGNYSRTLRDVA